MALHPMETTGPRGRQQFRLQPIRNTQPYQGHDPNAAPYDYRYAQPYNPVNPYQYGSMGGWAMASGPMYNPREEPAPQQPYMNENDGYTIDGVWYPYQQPLNIPDSSATARTRSQRTPGGNSARRGFAGQPADLRHGGMPDGFGNVVYVKNAGPPDPYQQPDVPISDRVRNQFEYYFSAKNLRTDSFMRGLMREDGYIPLQLLMDFPRMKVHKISPALAVRAANESAHLKVLGIDYPLQPTRPRDYFIRTKHSWWKYVANPEAVPEEEKIEDDADELIVEDMTPPPRRAKQSLWPDRPIEEDTMIDPGQTGDVRRQFENLRTFVDEDTMN